MVSIARKNLFQSPGRLVASVSGVAFSVLLVLFLLGVYNGFLAGTSAFIEGSGADVWIAQEGAVDIFHSRSLLPESLEGRIRGIPGVDTVVPLYARVFQAHVGDPEGPEEAVYAVGFDQRTGIGGPRNLVAGSLAPRGNEIVVSQAFTDATKAWLGEEVHFAERQWTIVGVVDMKTVSMFSYAFVEGSVAQEAFHMQGLANNLLVQVDPGHDPRVVASTIEDRIRDITAREASAFADESSSSIRELFVPILLSVTGIGFLIALAVISITSWSAINERVAEYGVLKAIGAENRFVYRIVFLQSAFASLAGFVLGVPLYFAVSRSLSTLMPAVMFDDDPLQIALVFLGIVAMGGLASFLPVRRIARIDPADVFRGA